MSTNVWKYDWGFFIVLSAVLCIASEVVCAMPEVAKPILS